MRKVILSTVFLLLAANASHATSVIEEIIYCSKPDARWCSVDIAVSTNAIAEGLLDGSLSSDEAAVLLKEANAIAKKSQNEKMNQPQN